MGLSGDHGRLMKWHPLVNFQFIKPFEKSLSQRAFSICTDIRKLQDKAKTSYTLSTRRLRFGYEQQFSRSTPGACFGVVGEELTAYLILEMAGAMR